METSALGRTFSGPQTHRKGADSAAPSNQAQQHRKHFLYVIWQGSAAGKAEAARSRTTPLSYQRHGKQFNPQMTQMKESSEFQTLTN
jgi:hypothetical protein